MHILKEQIETEFKRRQSFVVLFRMIIRSCLVYEDQSLSIPDRIQQKKDQYSILYQIMLEQMANYSSIDNEELIVLFFNDDSESKKLALKLGMLPSLRNCFVSFYDYCDQIQNLIEDYPELRDDFESLFNNLLILTYFKFTFLIDEGNAVTVIQEIKTLIKNFKKQQIGPASEETKLKRRTLLAERLEFDSYLTFNQNVQYFTELTELASEGDFVFSFMRDNLNSVLIKASFTKSKQDFLIKLYPFVPFLNPMKAYLSTEDQVALTDGYGNLEDYKYRMSERFFKKLMSIK